MIDSSTIERGGERLKLRLSAILWFLLLVGFLLGLPVLVEASPWIVVGVAVLALLLAFPIAWLVRRSFPGQLRQHWRTSYLKAGIATLFVLTALLAAPLYYLALQTALRPLTVPQATLSNGTKTVVFQGMVHVGSEGFYKSVIYDLEKALSEESVIYYEGVVGDPEGDAWFSETLAGGGDLSANYEMMGDACGLQFQLNYFQLLRQDMAAHPERHINADVSTADMMHEYQRLQASDPNFAQAVKAEQESKKTGDATERGIGGIVDLLQGATRGQRSLVGTACRGWLTMILARHADPSALDPVVLDFRNRKLAERISADTHQNIYMTYGAGHLPGLLADLQTTDPAWTIKSLKWMRAIDTPEDLSGAIQ
jgi:hypothetical protein